MSIIANAAKIAGRLGSKVVFKMKKWSPEMLLAGGVVCVVGGVALAYKQSEKTHEVLEKFEDRKAEIEEMVDVMDNVYTEEEAALGIRALKKDTVKELIKINAPVVGLELLGIACFCGSFGIMKKRNVALMAAYKFAEDRYQKYRQRVKEELGEDKERLFKLGLKEDPDTPPFDVEDGTATPGTSILDEYSQYARIFDESNVNWKKDPLVNKLFLNHTQDFCNDYLYAHGHLFLNQVYEWLGFPHTPEGAVCGWLLPKNGGGDGYVNFGLWDTWRPVVQDFQNGYERSFVLDFNHDGVIWDKI